ncbi:hypothetical protein IscW_ISCW012488 [Ixodes scapularis]|uniref:Uncharacterized protein n=1 Tax=Ixodes scapularis TaxID=6945 RepID=B7QA11_IXOSC|nr:hypothetical protein IscW_ISCW012488 [Ixodes scapularis]|eukprot:XP_002399687.1 hypothetical protein IscW_ISCW012488 [Ixodes scapularis]
MRGVEPQVYAPRSLTGRPPLLFLLVLETAITASKKKTTKTSVVSVDLPGARTAVFRAYAQHSTCVGEPSRASAQARRPVRGARAVGEIADDDLLERCARSARHAGRPRETCLHDV